MKISMLEKIVCRFCQSKNEFKGQDTEGPRSFIIPGASAHYAPDRPFQLEHIRLNIQIDPRQNKLEGEVTHRVKVVAPDQKTLLLDQIDLEVKEVTLHDRSIPFDRTGHHLVLTLVPPPVPGESFEFTVKYRAQNPRRGIYFTGPDSDYPTKPYQVWTQGQDEDSRYWFPTLDYPNQKATTEMIATVPKGYTAVSNGKLLSSQAVGDQKEWTRFHYQLNIPQVTYLITLVVAEFTQWADSGPRGLPVQFFVVPGREEDGKRAFSNTVAMIEAFEKKTRVPYPYEKYSQVAVQDFIFGGMENTSATTQTDLTLHDARAHLDFSSDPLVAHELAHQWFGDLLTCRDWSHGWLNEGFATFMERVWVENKVGPNGGADEAKYYSYQDLKAYLEDDAHEYRRPIVCNTYVEPIDLFDTHLYQKGGLVLNLIRFVLGEEPFWNAVHLYLTRFRGQNVETLDWIRAIEDATGKNLRRLFDEWIFQAGHPAFEVSYQWDDEKKLAEWVIEQKQTGGKPSLTSGGATTPLFHVPVILEMTLKSGQVLSHRIEVGELRERLFLPAPEKPVRVRFDPNFSIPKTLKFPRSKELLLNQLRFDLDSMGRIEAAQELGKISDEEIVKALGETAASDSFWGVQAEAAEVLSGIRMDSAKTALLSALGRASHPKARRAIVRALGRFRDPEVAGALKKVAAKDESYFVEAEATRAWVASCLSAWEPLSPAKRSEVEKFLLSQLEKNSYRDVIRSAALDGLALLPGISLQEHPEALRSLKFWTKRGHSPDVRAAAVRGLGRVLKHANLPIKKEILDLFTQLSDESSMRMRMQLVASLKEGGWPDAIPILSRVREAELDGRVKRACYGAIDGLLSAAKVPESVLHLKSALEKLEEEQKKLRSKLEEMGGARVT